MDVPTGLQESKSMIMGVGGVAEESMILRGLRQSIALQAIISMNLPSMRDYMLQYPGIALQTQPSYRPIHQHAPPKPGNVGRLTYESESWGPGIASDSSSGSDAMGRPGCHGGTDWKSNVVSELSRALFFVQEGGYEAHGEGAMFYRERVGYVYVNGPAMGRKSERTCGWGVNNISEVGTKLAPHQDVMPRASPYGGLAIDTTSECPNCCKLMALVGARAGCNDANGEQPSTGMAPLWHNLHRHCVSVLATEHLKKSE
ncbi:hypothetical protein JB92DRAFT_2824467 [Gautieria morchelliformis]|nr:hypothetical protein JB92DRAFT_2824467 [Gautieria morchelliformis]